MPHRHTSMRAMKQTIDASKAFADKYFAAAKPLKQ